MMPVRPKPVMLSTMPTINPPLFCGSECPSIPGAVCTIDPFHVGDHFTSTHGGVHWAKTPTLRDIPRAARVDPDTIPEKQLSDRSCYFCDRHARGIINDDIPTCGGHVK